MDNDYYKLEFRVGKDVHTLLAEGFQLGGLEHGQQVFSFSKVVGPLTVMGAFRSEFGDVQNAMGSWIFVSPSTDDGPAPWLLYSVLLSSVKREAFAGDFCIFDGVSGVYRSTRPT